MKHFRFIIQENFPPERLDRALFTLIAEKQDGISRAAIRRSIMVGGVYVNKKRVKVASRMLYPGAQVEIYFNDSVKTNMPAFDATKIQTLYKDKYIIVVNKPAGLPSVPSLDNSRDSLSGILAKQFPYLGIHHRLDKDTSGVLIFAIHKMSNGNLSEMFQERKAEKTYLAVASGKTPPQSWTEKSIIGRAEKKKNVYASGIADGRDAETHFRLISTSGNYLAIEAVPVTGRPHQIRVHLMDCGCPIVGDTQYGSREKSRVLLHAYKLKILHPVSGKSMEFIAPLPEDMQQFFQELLE